MTNRGTRTTQALQSARANRERAAALRAEGNEAHAKDYDEAARRAELRATGGDGPQGLKDLLRIF